MASSLFFLLLVLSCSGFLTASANKDNTAAELNSNKGQQGVGPKLWCVANPSVPDELLLANLKFACSEGGANCKALEPGSPCYNPNTLISHASYAMNLYYQAHGRNYWNCYFHGTGLVVFTDPSYGSCTYPAQ